MQHINSYVLILFSFKNVINPPAPHVLPHTLWTRGVRVTQMILKEEAGTR